MSDPSPDFMAGGFATAVDWYRFQLREGLTRQQIAAVAASMAGLALAEIGGDIERGFVLADKTVRATAAATPALLVARSPR